VQCDPETGAIQTLFREQGPAWIDCIGAPHWLPNGEFLWLSDLPNGRRHLYRVEAQGRNRTAMTSGDWDVEEIVHVQPDGKAAWMLGNIDGPGEMHLIRSDLETAQWTRLTRTPGQHRANVQTEGRYFATSSSHLTSPSRLSVHDGQGNVVRVLATSPQDRHRTMRIQSPKPLEIEARDGHKMPSMIIAPPELDLKHPSKKWPVIIHVYGGPRAPTIRNSWQAGNYWWHQYLAQQGFVVVLCDNRSALGKGNTDTWKIYKDMGRVELMDLEDCVAWLGKQGWADTGRVGLWGWSYGGYFTAYAMTHSKLFRAGIAGAPVTDWRNYDAIYTERYMDIPKNNAEGYKSSSVVETASQLHGRLLIIHGERDDNVHMSNTLQLAYALQNAMKPFDLMIYPRNRHGVVDPEQRYHMHRLMTEFFKTHLQAP
jgi:dipeptidyl-peptidase-4